MRLIPGQHAEGIDHAALADLAGNGDIDASVRLSTTGNPRLRARGERHPGPGPHRDRRLSSASIDIAPPGRSPALAQQPHAPTVTAMAAGPVSWVDPRLRERYLEHDGTVNDEEYGRPGGHLDALAAAGAQLSNARPVVLSVNAATRRASISDGNHRLILALEQARAGHHVLVPVLVSAEPSTHPGFAYDGTLGWPARPAIRRCIRRASPALTKAAEAEAERQARLAP